MYRTLHEGPRGRGGDGLARALVLYANALYVTGRYEQALVASDDSRAVADARMSPTQSAYALRVRTLVLTETGRLEEALATAQQCVAAYREAVPRGRERSLGSLADALRIQAWVLGRMGRVQESVNLYIECSELLREMSMWTVLLRAGRVKVRMLCEVTSGLRALGRFEEAVAAGTDALWWSRGMNPSYYPDILRLRAELLTDLAWCYAATGDPQRARDSSDDAVAVCRTLVKQDAETGEPRLVQALESRTSLAGQSPVPSADAQPHPERSASRQLADLRELSELCARLAVTDPHAYEPRLASALDELAFCHWAQGAHRRAVAVTERSVALFRRAAGRDPQEYEPELARTLANLAIRQRRADLPEDAVAHAREALAITRRLAEADPRFPRSLTAQRLGILARSLRRTGDDTQALACYGEAETFLRELMAAESGHSEGLLNGVLADLADTLRATAEAHLATGRFGDAVAALHRLLALNRRTDLTAVHTTCLAAFTYAEDAAPNEIRAAWQAATTDPFPSIVDRPRPV
ncbi:tetratricopeptide repeat protein [Streptomyces phaeoluteigriseus]